MPIDIIVVVLMLSYTGCDNCGTYDSWYPQRRLALGSDYRCPCCED